MPTILFALLFVLAPYCSLGLEAICATEELFGSIRRARDISFAVHKSTVAYGEFPKQKYDLFVPTVTDDSWPVIVFLHGGLWVARDKREYVGWGDVFAARGYVTAVVNYRLSSITNDVRPPSHVADLALALRTLQDRQPSRLARFVLVGHSCGANMAAQLAQQADRFNVDDLHVVGVVGLGGLYDLVQYARDFASWSTELEVTWGVDRATWESPQTIVVADGAARRAFDRVQSWLIVHFENDAYVNDIQAQRFVERLGSDRSRLHLIPGAHYDAVNGVALDFVSGSPTSRLVEMMEQFLMHILCGDDRQHK